MEVRRIQKRRGEPPDSSSLPRALCTRDAGQALVLRMSVNRRMSLRSVRV